MDETYQAYVNRVARLTLPETYQTQLQNIQESPKFSDRQPASFPGYSVITPPWQDNEQDSNFYTQLQIRQQQLSEQLQQLITPVPPESFHVTIADLIWDRDYREAIRENPQFETQLQNSIAASFEQYQHRSSQGTVCWQLLGLTIKPRSIDVCLVPKDEHSYERILELRRAIYQNSNLISLGVQQQYYFTAHVSLGYFSKIPPDLDRDRLYKILLSLNDQWLEAQPQLLQINQVQLRKFDDMMRYYREPDWPVLSVGS